MRGSTHIDQEAKGCPPAQAEDDVDWPVDKGPRKGNEPYQGKEHGQRRHHLGVDEAALGPVGRMAELVQVLARHAGDNGSEDELRGPEDNVDDAIDRHCGWFLWWWLYKFDWDWQANRFIQGIN